MLPELIVGSLNQTFFGADTRICFLFRLGQGGLAHLDIPCITNFGYLQNNIV
jgi:hypothetical protein